MRSVAVNLLWLVPGVVGGSEEYTLGLLRAVERIDPDDIELRLYARKDLVVSHPDLAERFEIITPPTGLGSKPARIATEASWLSLATRRDDLVHHAGGISPVTSPTPFVLSILDLQPLEMAENFSKPKQRWFATMLPRSASRASLVLTMSEFVAGTVTERLDVEADRLRLVPHGLDAIEPDSTTMQTRALAGSHGRFLLYPAIAYPHKRHVDLLAAFESLATRHLDLSLVLTGRRDAESNAIERRAREAGLSERVHVLGRVPAAELDALYRTAFAMVFPSVYEGFGLPLLEAMARGCPVIAADAASIPEVVGDAGMIVPARSPADIVAAVERLGDEEELRPELIRRGHLRAEHFSWRRAGLSLLDAYRDALARRDAP